MNNGKQKSKADILFEKIPPIIGVAIFLFPIAASFFAPELAAYFIIVLNVYFLYKSITYAVQFGIVLLKFRHNEQIDWMEKLKGLEDLNSEIKKLEQECEVIKGLRFTDLPKSRFITKFNERQYVKLPGLMQRLLFWREKRKTIGFLKEEIEKLKFFKQSEILDYKELQHVVIIPHVKEPYSILKATLECLKNQDYITKKINIVLGAEATDPNGVSVSEKLKEEFKDVFGNIWITNHVLGENEIVGKSSNMAWAGKEAAKKIEELGWDLSKVTVTSCDADSKLPPQYFAYLSYLFVTTPDSKYKFFNGAMVLYNNIWRLPFYARVKNSLSTIYNVGRLVRTDKLVPFSTYTTSLWLVHNVGYWTPWIQPEDFHLFFKSLFKFKDKVETVPLFVKIMSDSAEGDSHWETIKNNYKQERRWAWGISDDGWIIRNLLTNWSDFSLRTKYIAAHIIFDHIMGPIGSLLILVGGNIPPLLNPVFSRQVLGVKLPGVSSFVIQLTLFFMIIVIFLDFFLKPTPQNNSIFKRIGRILEWIIQPIAGIFLSIMPGLEAHTRLLFGRYMEYYVTKKKGDEDNAE